MSPHTCKCLAPHTLRVRSPHCTQGYSGSCLQSPCSHRSTPRPALSLPAPVKQSILIHLCGLAIGLDQRRSQSSVQTDGTLRKQMSEQTNNDIQQLFISNQKKAHKHMDHDSHSFHINHLSPLYYQMRAKYILRPYIQIKVVRKTLIPLLL